MIENKIKKLEKHAETAQDCDEIAKWYDRAGDVMSCLKWRNQALACRKKELELYKKKMYEYLRDVIKPFIVSRKYVEYEGELHLLRKGQNPVYKLDTDNNCMLAFIRCRQFNIKPVVWAPISLDSTLPKCKACRYCKSVTVNKKDMMDDSIGRGLFGHVDTKFRII